MRKKQIELFVAGVDDRQIVDQNGRPVSIEEARRLWEAGQVKNCDQSFHRLATRAGWDFAELARQYEPHTYPRGTHEALDGSRAGRQRG